MDINQEFKEKVKTPTGDLAFTAGTARDLRNMLYLHRNQVEAAIGRVEAYIYAEEGPHHGLSFLFDNPSEE